MATALEQIVGSQSFEVISTTGAVTGKTYTSIVVNSDAVFSVLQINGTSVMSSKGLTGVTIKAGAYLSAGSGSVFNAITLVSGTIICYN
jgi:hypothetical protein